MMPTPPATFAAALLLGLAGSVHCFAMCGPLACAGLTVGPPVVPPPSPCEGPDKRRPRPLRDGPDQRRSRLLRASRRRAALAYHAARLGGYTIVGGLLGAFGHALGRTFSFSLKPALPWLLAAALVGSALDLGGRLARRLSPLPGVSHILRRAARAGAASSHLRAAVLGGITPLLPCGLLYAAFAAAIAASSFAGGALLLAAFGLGAVPALLLAQLQTGLLERVAPRSATILRRAVPLLAAAVLVYRAVAVSAGHSCH